MTAALRAIAAIVGSLLSSLLWLVLILLAVAVKADTKNCDVGLDTRAPCAHTGHESQHTY